MISLVKSFFSGPLQMPEYQLIKKYDEGYEQREYLPSKWVSVSKEIMDLDTKKLMSDMFRSLFNYISGKNEGEQKVEMTAPVIREFIPGAGPACETKYTMSFLVPKEFTEKTPTPTGPGVFINELPAMTVFVKTFGGNVRDEGYMEEMQTFLPVLEKAGHKVRDDIYYFAGYDSPFKLFNRRNEVWLVKKESKTPEEECIHEHQQQSDE